MHRRLMRLSAATRATNSSTTAVIAGLPPSRSYSDPTGAAGSAAAAAPEAGAAVWAAEGVAVAGGGASEPLVAQPATCIRVASAAMPTTPRRAAGFRTNRKLRVFDIGNLQ